MVPALKGVLTAKGYETRARIVREAARIVQERGAGNTSLDEIQRAAGVSASQLYHYFADRNTLIRAVVEHQTGEVLGAQRRALEDLDGFAALERWRDMMIAAQDARDCTGGCPLGSMVGDLAETDPRSRGELAAAFKAWEALIADGLRSLQARGVLPERCDTGKLALSLLSSVQGGLILSQLHRNTDPLRAALDNEIAHLREIAAADTSA